MNSEEKSAELSANKDQVAAASVAAASEEAGGLGYGADQAGLIGSGVDTSVNQSNVYAPQAFYYRGYEQSAGEWDEYPQFVTPEGLDIGSPAMFNENPSLLFHTGYGYSPQMTYGPYSPVTTPLPSVHADGQLYSPHHFPFSGPPFYQQIVPSMPFLTSPTPISQPDLSSLVAPSHQNDGTPLGPNSGYPPLLGTFGGGNFPGNADSPGFHALSPGYEGFSPGALWSDWSKPADRQRSPSPFSPVPQHSSGSHGSYRQNAGMASQQQRLSYGFRPGSNSYQRGNMHSGYNQGSNYRTGSFSSSGANSQGWLAHDHGRQHVRIPSSICGGCNGSLDLLGEQNRGPRATKPKIQVTSDQSSSTGNSKSNTPTPKVIHNEAYNQPDFVSEYDAAKFFIIKSYSEDNVHKSIKYGVWASTPNGNRKLDAAYREAKERQGTCPVFLLFSVNASAQFCGVAEMTGPVDFEKSVDYWQQDKWSGQFPVKWHIIKDVPNSQFRHIVLENNDNKPVTNSRDTQEVKLEQGIEMLKIFKSYETEMSILDDFDFYEEREKIMNERKARQQASMTTFGVAGDNDIRIPITIPSGLINQMTKSFAQVVRLDNENNKDASVEKTTSVAAADAPQISASSPVHTS
uniref:YTH domain-containing family protein n=1 Tax=Kalanchoe fedtschenkoi TaxID=63787 RepID=A0A7N0RFX2_KALFE